MSVEKKLSGIECDPYYQQCDELLSQSLHCRKSRCYKRAYADQMQKFKAAKLFKDKSEMHAKAAVYACDMYAKVGVPLKEI